MVFEEHISEIEEKIGYSFADRTLLRQAFTRTSYCNEQKQRRGAPAIQSNEVLEFFGDTALSMAIITDLIGRFSKRVAFGIRTDFNEGDFSQIKSNLSEKVNLSLSMEKLGLEEFLLVGEGDRKLDIIHQPSVMEDLFESIIGAVYIDCGMHMETVAKTVAKMLDTSVYLREDLVSHNPKGALQEFCADKRRRLPPPEYTLLEQTRLENGSEEHFVCECRIGERRLSVGEGKNQKTAESNAAEIALALLKKEWEKVPVTVSRPEQTPMSMLNEWASVHHLPMPEFPETAETENSSDRSKEYLAECRFDGKVTTGVGHSKKTARQEAAAKMLGLIPETHGTRRKM